MKTVSRRGFSKLLGMLPLAAKQAADAEVAKLATLDQSGLATDYPAPPSRGPSGESVLKVRAALLDPFRKQAIEAMLYQEQAKVFTLDIDLASKKSFSLAAKICFQRQRNVEKRKKELWDGMIWDRLHKLLYG